MNEDGDGAHQAGSMNILSHPSSGTPEFIRGQKEAEQWRPMQSSYDAQVAASQQPSWWSASPHANAWSGSPHANAWGPVLGGPPSGGTSPGVLSSILGVLFTFTLVGVLLGGVAAIFLVRWENVLSHNATAPPKTSTPLPPGSLPSIEEVLAKTKVTDPIETLARQAVALNEVAWAIRVHSKAGEFGQVTGAEAAAMAPYSRLVFRLGEEGKELIRRRGAPATGWNTPQGQWSNLLNRHKGIAWTLWPKLQ